MACSSPHGFYTNVSILGLRAYIDDAQIVEVLSQYGEIKDNIIRLRYKADHDLAGLENGNRLACMILNNPSIPYSLKIGNEWCRIIHSNQQPIYRECNELGHSPRRCLQIVCRLCHQNGHMSNDCEERFNFPPCTSTDSTSESTPEPSSTDATLPTQPPEPEQDFATTSSSDLPSTQEPSSTATTHTALATDRPSTPTPPLDTSLDPMEVEHAAKNLKCPHNTI